MATIDLAGLDAEKLTDLLGRAQGELASRERQSRKALRAELERRVAAEGYAMSDIFPELGASSSGGTRRRRPARYRTSQNSERTWSGIGRTPKWVQSILDDRGIDMAAVQVDSDVSAPWPVLSEERLRVE